MVFTVTNTTNGPCIYATSDHADAVAWAQNHADADPQTGATPHYVITAWGPVSPPAEHIYAQRADALRRWLWPE